MKKEERKKIPFKLLFFFAPIIILFFIFFIHFIADIFYHPLIFSNLKKIPPTPIALVLGAGLKPNGTPSDILFDRLKAAASLYKGKKISKIIVSGDNRFNNYNEPNAMKRTLISLGIPAKHIQADYAGRRTYDSCWRLKHIFSQNKSIVITQSFHITRSLFLCNALGVQSKGFIADTPRYSSLNWMYWSIRDIFGFSLAIVDVYFRKPSVIKGSKIQI